MLLAVVVGSGTMGERLAAGNVALALLANSLATGAALVVLILQYGPISGAHFNPVVTLAMARRGDFSRNEIALYIGAQVIGALLGVGMAHAMFGLPLFSLGSHARTGGGQWFSEMVATFGLVSLVLMLSRARPQALPAAVGLYIAAAYWFTASTSFANPAVTLARSVTDTFAGIRPADAPAFILAQFAGMLLAAALVAILQGAEQTAAGIAAEERGSPHNPG